MCFLFSGLFWGLILILLGLSVIIQVVFHIHIPFFRILFAIILIYWGISLLTGGRICHHSSKSSFCVTDSTIASSDIKSDYNVLFGKEYIDLSNPDLAAKNTNVRVNTVFGSVTIKIDPQVPTIIEVSSAFAGAQLPDKNTISFGNYTYKTKSYSRDINRLKIDARVVFGEFRIVEK